jgi:thiamine-phosphate pyrophosphorylase
MDRQDMFERMRGSVIALGGMTAGSAATARDAGAAGIAVMGDMMRTDDPETTSASLLATFGGAHAPAPV